MLLFNLSHTFFNIKKVLFIDHLSKISKYETQIILYNHLFSGID